MGRSPTSACSRRLGKMKVGFQDKRTRAVARLPEFDALRDQARDIKNHVLATPRPLSGALREQRDRQRRQGALVPRRRAKRATRSCEICRSVDAQDRDQGQVDDRRGDRAQRSSWRARHRAGRDRSRRVHHPASRARRPATSSRPAIHLTKEQVAESLPRGAHDARP